MERSWSTEILDQFLQPAQASIFKAHFLRPCPAHVLNQRRMFGAYGLLFVLSIYVSIYVVFITPISSSPILLELGLYNDLISRPSDHLIPLQSRSTEATTPVASSKALHKRSILGDDWEVYWFDGPAYFPVDTAAKVLIDFYVEVLRQTILNSASNHPPLNRFSFRRGHIAFSCYCRWAPIPWDLLHTIATEMLEFTMKGYTAQYIAKFVHAEGWEIDLDMAVGAAGPVAAQDTLSSNGGSSRRSDVSNCGGL